MSDPRLPSKKTFVVTAMTALVASTLLALSRPATLTIDGQRIVSDVPPVTQVRDVFVPVRAVAEGLGGETAFDPKTGVVEITRGSDVFRMKIGSHTASLNGNKMTVKYPPFMVRGRAMIGLHALSRALGTKYNYDAGRATIDVSTPGVVEAGAQQYAP